ncbi:MAG: hypothetical protein IKG61_04275, partial [Selenomonadaceae bacterium]|nr:hypothetical protein [Selenomonadaceae bacterium]
MLKKFLTCFSLLLVLVFAATAQAKSAELTRINAFDLDDETLRIEISYRGGKIEAGDVSTNLSSGILRVELDNTLPGRVSRVSGTQIDSAAKNFVEKILTNKTRTNHTSIQVQFNSATEGDVKFFLEPADRSDKKDACVVVDVKKNFADNSLKQYFDGDGQIIVL